jgi:hypothetical protein
LRGTAYDTDRPDHDYYRFEAVSGRTYVVETFNAAASIGSNYYSLEMWVYDSSLNLIASDTDDPINGSGNTNASVSFQAPRSGTYYIKVEPERSSGYGNYSLRVLPKYDEPGASWDANYEPNNFPANAYQVTPGRTNAVSSSIELRGTAYDTDRPDHDYYRFEAVSGRTYVVETFNAAASIGSRYYHLEMWVYDSVLNELGNSTNNGSGNTNASVSFQASSSGTHYIKVEPERSSGYGSYSLRVLTKYDEPGASWDANYEPNNFPANAYQLQIDPCAISTDIEARLSNYNTTGPDRDWFVFTTIAGEQYTINVVDIASSLSGRDGLALQLYDQNLNLRQQATEETQVNITLDATYSGNYYLQIEPDDSNDSGSYRVRVASSTDTVCPVVTYTISGRIVNSDNTPMAGITITTGTGSTTTTASDGSYTLTGLTEGSYTITPQMSGYAFEPASRTVSVSNDTMNVHFTATRVEEESSDDSSIYLPMITR